MSKVEGLLIIVRLFGKLSWLQLLAFWIVFQIAVAGITAKMAANSLQRDFAAEVSGTKRSLAVKLAQHDTNIFTLAALSDPGNTFAEAGFSRISQSILGSYPAIERIQRFLIDRSTSRPMIVLDKDFARNRRDLPAERDYKQVIDTLPTQAVETPQVYPFRGDTGFYMLAYRLPGQDIGLLLTIDGTELLGCGAQSPDLEKILRIGETSIAEQNPHVDSWSTHIVGGTIEEIDLGRPGLPFVLYLDRPILIDDLLPWRYLLVIAVLSAAVLWTLRALGVEARIAGALRVLEEDTNRRLVQLEHENRLAHASRVNAMGELASGIAHELTQPLTALLSQSQAGLKAFEADDSHKDVVLRALSANVREAKRAGRILGKMRDHVSAREVISSIYDVNRIVRDVVDLLNTELKNRKIEMVVDLAPLPLHSIVGEIELEQVVYNLVRNAMDALEENADDERRIVVRTYVVPDRNLIEVRDNGPGIKLENIDDIFQPFYTTKANGLGLGLSLCTKLLERVGGRLEASSDRGAAFKIMLPKAEVQS